MLRTGVDRRVAFTLLAVLAASLASGGCVVRLAAEYDEHVDRGATALQQEMDSHLTRLEVLGADVNGHFDLHEPFYLDYAVKLRSLRLRAQAYRRNELTLQQLDLMLDSLEELNRQHAERGTLSPAFIASSRDLFNQAWGAVIAWEVAKKRGAR